MCSDAQEEGLVTLLAELGDGHVAANFDAGLELHAHVADHLNFGFDDVPRQTVGGNADGEHAAQHRQFFEDRHLIAFESQIVGTGQTSWSRADDRHLFVTLDFDFGHIAGFRAQIEIGYKPFDKVNGHRFVHLPSRTGRLTRMMADPSADCRQRILFLNELQGFQVLTLRHQRHVALNTDVGRADGLARAGPLLVDGKRAGNRLGIALISRFPGGEALVVFVLELDRADGGTFTAPRALIPIDEAGLLQHRCLEAARLPLQGRELTESEQFDIGVAGTFDQFG